MIPLYAMVCISVLAELARSESPVSATSRSPEVRSARWIGAIRLLTSQPATARRLMEDTSLRRAARRGAFQSKAALRVHGG